MMVVMQLFSTNENAPGRNIAGRIPALEITITPVMADAIDDARSKQRNPHHLYRPDGQTNRPEQHQIDGHHHVNAGIAVGALGGVGMVGTATRLYEGC